MASNNVQIAVIQHLIFDRNFQPAFANQVYQQAINLYHELHTILSSLIVIIRENLELKDSFK